MAATRWRVWPGRIGRNVLDRINQRRQPISDIQRRRLSGQNMIAQRPKHDRQIADQSLGGGVFYGDEVLKVFGVEDVWCSREIALERRGPTSN